MKKCINFLTFLLLMTGMMAMLSGCAAIAGIFKAGVWVGVVGVIFVVGLILYFVSRGSGK